MPGFPGQLLQGDILQALSPFMTVRSDTFTIRAYGESRDPGAEARCGPGPGARPPCSATRIPVPDADQHGQPPGRTREAVEQVRPHLPNDLLPLAESERNLTLRRNEDPRRALIRRFARSSCLRPRRRAAASAQTIEVRTLALRSGEMPEVYLKGAEDPPS